MAARRRDGTVRWHCVEEGCRDMAVSWLTFTLDDGSHVSYPFCERHVEMIVGRAKRQRPGVPIEDKRRDGKRWLR